MDPIQELRFAKGRLMRRILSGGSEAFGTQNQSAREIWLEQAIARLPHGTHILDAGAGEQKYRRFCTDLEYVSQDFARYDGLGDGVGLQSGSWDRSSLDLVSDIVSIPVVDASFDAVMCIEVLEHLPDPIRALYELTRVLRLGGVLILTAPFCSLTHQAPHFYHTGYSPYFYKRWLGELGYEIEDMQRNGNYFEYLGQEIRRVPAIARRYAGRSPSLVERLAIAVMLGALDRFSQQDHGSEELLCFGLHILARKTAPSAKD